MARPGRYTESRLYAAASAIALVLIVWAALAVRDYYQERHDDTEPGLQLPATGAAKDQPGPPTSSGACAPSSSGWSRA
jgi:hypothetical protein